MAPYDHVEHLHPHPRRDLIVGRMRRIEGQVRGIIRMLEEGRPCYDVLVQCAAAKAALGRAHGLVLKDHIGSCVAHGIEQEAGDLAIAEVEEILDRLVP